MPEGPSIVILREQVAALTGRTIVRAEGNARIEMARLTLYASPAAAKRAAKMLRKASKTGKPE